MMNGLPISRRQFLLGGTALFTVALSGCVGLLNNSDIATRQTSGAAPAVPAGTDPDDTVIGLREHPRIIANYGGVYEYRKTEVMLARMVSRLLAAAGQPDTQFTVTILDSSEVNAFALPGGFIYVTRGILALANDMSELAAVIAHEIAHVILRHARARSNRVRTSEIVDRVVTSILGGVIDPNATAQRSAESLAAFSQRQELEADQEGIKIAARAGYDPHAAARFLTAMGRFAQFVATPGMGDDFLSSHPSTPDRIQRAVEAAREYGAPGTGTTDREGYLRAIEGMDFGDNTRQGAIVGKRYVNPAREITFEVPRAYELQISNAAVVAVAGDGAALRFDSASVQPGVSLADYLRSGWIAGLMPETVTTQTLNGIEMASGRAQTDQWYFHVTVARIGEDVYRFIFAGKEDTEAFRRDAENTIASFRRTRASDLSSIRKVKLELVTARSGDTADSLARRMSTLNRGRELFLVLNNLLPGDPVEAGASYKVVEVV
ncbi:M48 family metalloprotease [Pelagibacterium xiamenense]|uniref:M48 family metalloprotease n=1 Tax=Pelagibacterium xiamenense TaxID=2901140 RepID=UPI001E354A40|nr:M48 family metalloprotease [Pelagibacterium xiamenense]MCD7061281.1 M48 family metalloprotease [Pelagibacterium xiamenense]